MLIRPTSATVSSLQTRVDKIPDIVFAIFAHIPNNQSETNSCAIFLADWTCKQFHFRRYICNYHWTVMSILFLSYWNTTNEVSREMSLVRKCVILCVCCTIFHVISSSLAFIATSWNLASWIHAPADITTWHDPNRRNACELSQTGNKCTQFRVY